MPKTRQAEFSNSRDRALAAECRRSVGRTEFVPVDDLYRDPQGEIRTATHHHGPHLTDENLYDVTGELD